MSRPAFTICLCPDSRLLRDRIDSLLAAHSENRGAAASAAARPNPAKESLCPASAVASSNWRRFVFWADEGLSPSFWERLTLQGLFAEPKALVLRNAHTLAADSLKQLSGALTPMGASHNPVWPLICFEVAFDKGRAKIPAHIPPLSFWRLAEQKGWIEEIPGLLPQTMTTYVRAATALHGIAASAGDIQKLVRFLPPDAAQIHSELAKLALTVDEKGQLPSDALSLMDHSREVGLFELMRIMQEGKNAPDAWRRILEDRLTGENMIFACIAVLLREARTLWRILAGEEPYLPPQAAARAKTTAQRLGFGGVARLWEISLMADKGIKTGERTADQALEMLAADLFRLFGAARNG